LAAFTACLYTFITFQVSHGDWKKFWFGRRVGDLNANNNISRIAIVTDSTSDLPKELVRKYNITVVPLTVNFEDESFVDDGISLTIDEFYQKLKASAITKDIPAFTRDVPDHLCRSFKDT
jgi:hypothetical protein